ncbi:MAG: hypothetical protein FJ146_14560 [Deltaproteobacteria bacterium]|nr:hypothetical protein [Deltaproteobacteria bacterium]
MPYHLNHDLLGQVSNLGNVTRAFRACARGKRGSRGYQLMQMQLARELVAMSHQLASGDWPWQAYNSFVVCDPKRRTIYAAPFRDRVVHHAIHQVIAPLIEPLIPPNSWACRKTMGSRNAVSALTATLKKLGNERYTVKLDVANYFASISHEVLGQMLRRVMPDPSLDILLASLLSSHPEYARCRRGIPLGNLTSQLFANFYLSPVDHLAARHEGDVFYIRYMDDMVLVGASKKTVLDLKDQIVALCQRELRLKIPVRKTVHLASDPVPFLGFVLYGTGYHVLARTKRRHRRKVNKLTKAGKRASEIAAVVESFAAFANLDDALRMVSNSTTVTSGGRPKA